MSTLVQFRDDYRFAQDDVTRCVEKIAKLEASLAERVPSSGDRTIEALAEQSRSVRADIIAQNDDSETPDTTGILRDYRIRQAVEPHAQNIDLLQQLTILKARLPELIRHRDVTRDCMKAALGA